MDFRFLFHSKIYLLVQIPVIFVLCLSSSLNLRKLAPSAASILTKGNCFQMQCQKFNNQARKSLITKTFQAPQQRTTTAIITVREGSQMAKVASCSHWHKLIYKQIPCCSFSFLNDQTNFPSILQAIFISYFVLTRL